MGFHCQRRAHLVSGTYVWRVGDMHVSEGLHKCFKTPGNSKGQETTHDKSMKEREGVVQGVCVSCVSRGPLESFT